MRFAREALAVILYPVVALLSLVVVVVGGPLNVAMRSDRRARDEADLDREIDYDDPGRDVDGCARCGGALAYDGAQFCGAACAAQSEAHR